MGKMWDEEDKVDAGTMDFMQKRRERIDKKSENMKKAVTDPGYSRMIERFKSSFDNHIKELIKVLRDAKKYDTHIANLATRLDYNGFYAKNILSDDKD